MFKSRLSAWGFNKNSRDREYQHCALLLKDRKLQGRSETVFIIDEKRRRTLRDLRKYIKGRKMTEDSFCALAEQHRQDGQLQLDGTIRAITPPPDGEEELESFGGASRGKRDSSDPEVAHRSAPPYSAKASAPNFAPVVQGITNDPILKQQEPYGTRMKHDILGPRSTSTFSPSHLKVEQQAGFPSMSANSPQTPMSPNSSPISRTLSQEPSPRPRRSSQCQYFDQHHVDMMAYQTVHCQPLQDSYGVDNLDGFKLLQRYASHSCYSLGFKLTSSQAPIQVHQNLIVTTTSYVRNVLN
jgi:hypothetical protein